VRLERVSRQRRNLVIVSPPASALSRPGQERPAESSRNSRAR
jgi:hypothetical protein